MSWDQAVSSSLTFTVWQSSGQETDLRSQSLCPHFLFPSQTLFSISPMDRQQAAGEGQPLALFGCNTSPVSYSAHSQQLVQALRKALEPALSDISVDWFVPDAVEALLTPREIPALYPGDQLLGYCSLFRVDGFRSRPPGVDPPGWAGLLWVGLGG
jgi:hypothetical protein